MTFSLRQSSETTPQANSLTVVCNLETCYENRHLKKCARLWGEGVDSGQENRLYKCARHPRLLREGVDSGQRWPRSEYNQP